MTSKGNSSAKALVSLLILALFIWGVGKSAFFPSLRLLQDTQWDSSFFFPAFGIKLLSFLWVLPVGLGFLGWARWFQYLFFPKVEKEPARLLGFAITLSFFSLYVFGLAINEILYWPLTTLFFIPPILKGLEEWKTVSLLWQGFGKNKRALWLAIPLSLWIFEYLSPPLVWDAILDHFRFAREVSRLHQILFHWTNHTGDMPKAAELVLAGFWNLGGENLSKFSSALPAFLTAGLFLVFDREWKGRRNVSAWIFWTCPFFMAINSWGYVEGFLAFFEVLALYCSWKAFQEPKNQVWLPLMAFFLGTAFVVKYTAVLAFVAIGIILFNEKFVRKNPIKVNFVCLLAIALPMFPWLLKNWLAFDNPFYPLLTSVFGVGIGYSPVMEQGLLTDTGLPLGVGFVERLHGLWNSFFTTSNAVNAPWTPLVLMSFPWVWTSFKKRMGVFLFSFSILFLVGWFFISSSFRHASGGVVVLVLLASMAWEEALKKKDSLDRIAFGAGTVLSLWLCLSTQLTTTAPYASALGLEDPFLRLKRHFLYSTNTYSANKYIEEHSDSKDKVVAFAVYQDYPLNRIAFVDFKWKRPIFLQWVSKCKTAEQLANLLREEGVRFFLYQEQEALFMSKVEKDFNLAGMPASEYIRFWQYYMDPVKVFENSIVYEVRSVPLDLPQKFEPIPGFQEKGIRFVVEKQ